MMYRYFYQVKSHIKRYIHIFKAYASSKKQQRYFLYGLLSVLGSLVMGMCLLLIFVYLGVFGHLPGREALGKIENYTASEVYSSDEVLLGKYYLENRTPVAYQQISPAVRYALLATEDARFFFHNGIDYKSLVRVFFKTLLLGDDSSGGGSTISQQLAKNLYPRKDYALFSTIINKFREMIIARRLEDVYSKKAILTLYLNTVPFGDNAFGIATASRTFFNKPADSLQPEEAATLIGLLKATTNYNPRINPENAKQRRNVVINQMAKFGFLSFATSDSLQALPLNLEYHPFDHNVGAAPYFREKLRLKLEEILKNYQKPDGSPYNLYTDGLKIHTTIHSRLQQYAEEAVNRHMAYVQKIFNRHWKNQKPWDVYENLLSYAQKKSSLYKDLKKSGASENKIDSIFHNKKTRKVFTWEGPENRTMSPMDSIKHYLKILQAGLVAMDPQTGQVKAWVGGIDHQFFQYDHVTAQRQAGSTFKPFIYAAALQNGTDPCKFIANEKKAYASFDDWEPKNAANEYGGYYSMEGALTHSINVISVKLLMDNSISDVINLAHQLGIKSNLPQVPSLALGTAEVTLLEMVNAYSGFANQGKVQEPHYITRIENKSGDTIADFTQNTPPASQALSDTTAQLMRHMLQAVVDSGTAQGIRKYFRLPSSIAGKTGTTQDHADGWFIGFTPNLVTGVWVGGSNRRIHFRNLQYGQGSFTALPIWARFMQTINNDRELKNEVFQPFPALPDPLKKLLDCPHYKERLDKDFWNIFEKIFNNKKEASDTQKRDKPQERKEMKESKERREKRSRKIINKLIEIFR